MAYSKQHSLVWVADEYGTQKVWRRLWRSEGSGRSLSNNVYSGRFFAEKMWRRPVSSRNKLVYLQLV